MTFTITSGFSSIETFLEVAADVELVGAVADVTLPFSPFPFPFAEPPPGARHSRTLWVVDPQARHRRALSPFSRLVHVWG